jgi:tetratricopeptide (TPR) repeat protein
MRQGKLPEAREVNDEILKENPKDPDALGVKAALLLDNGEVTQAIIALRDVVTHAPDNPVAHYNLGRAYFRHQDFEQARQQFQKAIDLRPDYVLSLLALAQLQWATSDFDAAFRTAQVVLTKHDQNNASAKLIQSAALMGQKKYAESRQMLDAMLKANPSSPDVLFQIGVVNLAERKYKEADDSFRRSYQLNPANTRGLMGVVETYMAQNKTDQAIQQLQEEVAKTPARAELHIALGNVGVGAGRWDMAIAQFQAVLATVPKNSRTQGEMYLRIGETQRRKGDFNAAIVSFQAARQTLPEDARVLSSLALTLDGAGDWKHAKEAYQATNKLYPNNAVVLNNLAFGIAEHAEHGEELDQALGMAQRAKQLLSTMPEVSDTLGWIYLKKNLPDNAIEIFRELVDKQPNQATFRYHLGMALSQKGDKARALQELKKALETSTSDPERKSIRDLITRLG